MNQEIVDLIKELRQIGYWIVVILSLFLFVYLTSKKR
jgi:hypothetical protein